MPAMITAVTTVPDVRASNEWLSSSMAKTTPASGVLNAAATPAAPPASTSARSSSSRGRRATTQRVHDRGTDLHGRAFTADRGAAGQAEQGQYDLADCDAHRKHARDRVAIGHVLRGDHLRNAAALRARENMAGQQERGDEAGGTDDERDPGTGCLELHEQAGGKVRQCREADRGQRHQYGADPEHHPTKPLPGGRKRQATEPPKSVAHRP